MRTCCTYFVCSTVNLNRNTNGKNSISHSKAKIHVVTLALLLTLASVFRIKVMHYKSITASNRRIIVMSISIVLFFLRSTFDGILHQIRKPQIAIYCTKRYEFGSRISTARHLVVWLFSFQHEHTHDRRPTILVRITLFLLQFQRGSCFWFSPCRLVPISLHMNHVLKHKWTKITNIFFYSNWLLFVVVVVVIVTKFISFGNFSFCSEFRMNVFPFHLFRNFSSIRKLSF